MLVMHLCVRGVDVGHVFMCYGYQCWSCMCVFGYRCWLCICVLGYRCWSCIRVLGVSLLVIYLFVRGIDDGHVLLC
jgi:hypothetical protein